MDFLNPIGILSILIALSVHEWAHAYTAMKLGDPTAYNEGRVTLNPIAHLDPVGSLLFLLIGFGWGKPVPVNPHYFKRPLRDNAITALAGPLSNFVLAAICFYSLYALSVQTGTSAINLLETGADGSVTQEFFIKFFSTSLFLNLGLMAFNLLPIAPLDGSKILQAFIPLRYEDMYEEFMRRGPFVLLGLLIAEHLLGISIISGWVLWIMGQVLQMFAVIVGA
jgi:Zn-dependent protease